MSNMKVGGRVYRDIEKMNLDELHEVRIALVTLLDKKVKEGSKIQRTPQGQATFSRLNKEIQEIQLKLKRIDQLAKPLIKADTQTKLTANDAALTHAAEVGETNPAPILDLVESLKSAEAKLIIAGRTQGKSFALPTPVE